MAQPADPNLTADVAPADDSLDAGLVAAFGPASHSSAGASVLQELRHTYGVLRPVLLHDAEGDSAHVVRPYSDAMPELHETGARYQLAGEIARGGMGAVLRGRDVDLGRDLAVKVLLDKHAANPEVARRFFEEAQVGAQLQHPGIVPVYDLGRFGDRPFFTMKLVKGRTLSALLSERADLSEDRPRFLGIFLQVCHTLAYAHAKGVIHRDLKPANVMVGAFGEVQVMDWGLAKVLPEGGVADEARTVHGTGCRPPGIEPTVIRTARSGSHGSFGSDTEAGSLMGTPAYMPPEQANGDVELLDPRADVFGLGAILCELLTGKPPYVGRSAEEVRRKAANGDQTELLARLDAGGADAELLTLAKACLAPEPIDRPRDAQAVADGVAGYLDGVQERLHRAELDKAAAEARAAAEGRERRAAEGQAGAERRARRVQLALAATVLLALTLGGGGGLWVRAERDARQAQVSRDVNGALNQAAALQAQAATATAGGEALFAQAREQAQRALALVESGPADAALVAQVRRLQAELDAEERDRKLVAALDEARLAQAETLSENRFASERAVPVFREAFRAYGLPAGDGEPKAVAERIRQRPAAVREAIVAALDEWDDLAGDPKLGTTEPQRGWLQAVLAAAEPEDAWGRQVRAARAEPDNVKKKATLEALAASADVAKVPARALTQLAKRLDPGPEVALLRRAQAQYPADFWVNHNLGQALKRRVTPREPDEAVRFLTAAVALRPDSPGALINLGGTLCDDKKDYDGAIACFRRAIALDPKYAQAHTNLGHALRDKGLVDEAMASYQKAVELYQKTTELDPKSAKVHHDLGKILCDVKRDYDGAIACFRQAIALDPKYALAHVGLGVALHYKGQVDESLACWRLAIDLDPTNIRAHLNLGQALKRQGEADEAIPYYQKVIEFAPKNAEAHSGLGGILCDIKGDYDEAIACFRTAIELNPNNSSYHTNLGTAQARKGQVDEAIACFRKAIELNPTYARAHMNLGIELRHKGQWDEAIAEDRKAIELDPTDAKAHNNLGLGLMGKGQVDEAIAEYKKAIELEATLVIPRDNLAKAERMAAVRDKLAAFRDGSYTPFSNEERLGLAEWCRIKKLHRAVAGLYAAAFAADPKLADDVGPSHRYSAACNAALAAAGQGEDAAKLDEKERTRLRQQALDWLRADLSLRIKKLETGPPADRAAVRQALRQWQKDPDLASVRDADALAKLPAEQRAAGARLWADVAALLQTAETTTKEAKP